MALQGLPTAVFLADASMKSAAVPFEVEGFARSGYPPCFMNVVGILQRVGAVLIWTRGCVALGACLLAVLMSGAVGSHLLAGDPVSMSLSAFVLLILLVGVAHARRSEPLPSSTDTEVRQA